MTVRFPVVPQFSSGEVFLRKSSGANSLPASLLSRSLIGGRLQEEVFLSLRYVEALSRSVCSCLTYLRERGRRSTQGAGARLNVQRGRVSKEGRSGGYLLVGIEGADSKRPGVLTQEEGGYTHRETGGTLIGAEFRGWVLCLRFCVVCVRA